MHQEAPIGSAWPAWPGTPLRGGLPAAAWWFAGIVVVLVFALRDFLGSNDGLIAGGVFWGRDFINVWTGGQLIRQGELSALYDLGAYAEFQRGLFGELGPHNYSYPPVSFPLAAGFSMLPYPLALATWTAATGALFIWAARPWWPRSAGPAWLAILTPAAMVNIWAGHYGFLLGALFLLGWRKLDDQPVQAGICFGLMLVKPHLAVLVPLVLLIRRDWTALASGAVTVASLIGATTWWYGWQAWHDFLFTTTGVQASMINAGSTFFGLMSPSAATAVLRIGGSWPLALAVQALFSVAAVGMVALAAARRVPVRDLALLTATATFLLLPYAFNYDLTVVMIGALVVLSRADIGATDYRLALYGFLAPQLGMIFAAFGLPLMPLMVAGLALAQFRLALADRPPSDMTAFKRDTASAA